MATTKTAKKADSKVATEEVVNNTASSNNKADANAENPATHEGVEILGENQAFEPVKQDEVEGFTVASFTQFLKELAEGRTKVARDIQKACIIACNLLAQHRSIQIIRNLIAATKGDHLEVSRFVEKYGQVKFDEDGVAQFDKTKAEPNMEAMLDARWDKVKRDSVYKPMNLLSDTKEYFDRVLKQAKNRLNKSGQSLGDVITADDIHTIEAMRGTLIRALTPNDKQTVDGKEVKAA